MTTLPAAGSTESTTAAMQPTATTVAAHRTIRLLVFTSLYPNAEQPRHGIFVEERLRHLIATGHVRATVVAPVPWFPFKSRRFGRYAKYARVPPREERYGITIVHPRYPVIPKVGMHLSPALMARAVQSTVRELLARQLRYDLIDAHYLYPDGVAAVALAQRLGMPIVVTARGSDVTLIANQDVPRRRILRAVRSADATIAVSAALRDGLVRLGADGDRIAVLRNGVDLTRFRPVPAEALRNQLHPPGAVWLAVGNLVKLKGVHLVIQALKQFQDITLLIAGDGPEESALRTLAEHTGVAARVQFLGAVGHDALPAYYCAADALVLASSREGMPNVALEALACGTPIVAAPFAGAEEVVSAPAAGEIAASRTPEALGAAWQRLQARRPQRNATREFAESLGWGPVVAAQYALYAQVLAKRRQADTGAAA